MQNLKKVYTAPVIEEWTVAGLTQVGQSHPGDDTLPDGSRGRDGGSVYPPGLD